MTRALHVLVIDPAPSDFATLETHLKRVGLCAGCRRVEDVLGLSEALVERSWDIVISECEVPGLDLTEALDMVTACIGKPPVILYTEEANEEQALALLEMGVSDYVLKDRPARLIPTIRRALKEAKNKRAHQLTEQTLRDNDERFRMAMQGSHDGLWDWVLGTGQVYYSPAWKAMLGYEDQELTNELRTWKALCHPDDLELVMSKLDLLLAQGAEHFEVEFRMHHKDGHYLSILSRAHIARDEYGNPTRLVGTHMDLTPIRRTEQSLCQAAVVFKNTHDGIVVTDQEGNILTVNPAFSAITGYSQDEAVGRNIRSIHAEHQDPGFYQQIWTSLTRIGYWQGAVWERRKNGELYLQWSTISAVRTDETPASHYVTVFSDVSRHSQSRRLDRFAHEDSLTTLPNHVLLHLRLEHALQRCRRRGSRLGILILDLDHFSTINDTLGQAVGDHLVKQVASRLKDSMRGEDTLARFGGDVFVVILEELKIVENAGLVAEKLLAVLHSPFVLDDGREIHLSASIGIAVYPDDGHDPEELIRQADHALNMVKRQGRGHWCFHTPPPGTAPNTESAVQPDPGHATTIPA